MGDSGLWKHQVFCDCDSGRLGWTTSIWAFRGLSDPGAWGRWSGDIYNWSSWYNINIKYIHEQSKIIIKSSNIYDKNGIVAYYRAHSLNYSDEYKFLTCYMAQVATTSMFEMTILWASNLPVNPVLFRLLRIGKLSRAIRMVTMTNILPLGDSTKSSKCRPLGLGHFRILGHPGVAEKIKCTRSLINVLFPTNCSRKRGVHPMDISGTKPTPSFFHRASLVSLTGLTVWKGIPSNIII